MVFMQNMNKRAASCALLLAVGSAMAVTGCAGGGAAGGAADASGAYTPGTYTGVGQGRGGDVQVTLTVDGNSIVSVDEIVGDKEGLAHGKVYIEDGTFAAQIMEAQSADIDGASGSTKTTEGVKEATQDALDQASSGNAGKAEGEEAKATAE